LDKQDFISKFGSIFEHSSWVAERAFDLWQQDLNANSVHKAMCQAFNASDKQERQNVIDAHPDLAGKLAQAKRLTAESTNEQASAGLDALTDSEREQFTSLNETYKNKHSFVFIIAVKDHTKASILEAFEKRINHSTEDEFNEACAQIERIAYHRLHQILSKD